MSKQIKQMEMDALKQTFEGVRDLVVLTTSGLTAQADNQMRLGLRKKKILMRVVKNSLARRVFDDMGLKNDGLWEGNTLVAWGAGSLAELSRELETITKKNDKLKVKAAVSEGQTIPFKQALSMPTRVEAIARVVGLVLSPASRLVSQVLSPASRLAAQIKTLTEKPAAEGAPAADAAAPAAS